MKNGQTLPADTSGDAGQSRKGQLGEAYLAVVALFEHGHISTSPEERALAREVLSRLAKDVEMSIRIALAERLADAGDAPHDLILLLANDAIEIARPVLLRSPLLTGDDLLSVIASASVDHHVAIAERPDICERVSDALAQSPSEQVVVALVRNRTAKIGAETFGRLARRAEEWENLREPLVSRADLPPAISEKLVQWVRDGLKTALSQRFPEFAPHLGKALDRTAESVANGQVESNERTAQRLIKKLAVSGLLKPSFLIRVLNQGQMDLFEYGFATLLGVELEAICRAIYGDSPKTAALACRAVGIDRAVFLTVFGLARHHRGLTGALSEADRRDIDEIFRELPKATALARLKLALAA